MKRTLTLVGSILGAAAAGIMAILLTIGLISIENFAPLAESVQGGFTTLSFVGVGGLIVILATLAFNIITAINWNKSEEVFAKRIGFVITAIAVSTATIIFACAGFSIFAILIPYLPYIPFLIITNLMVLMLIASIVLELICIVRCKQKKA